MKKTKRILALIGVVILLGMYLLTLVFALSSNPNAKNFLMASIACTIVLPCLIYAFSLIGHVLDNRSRFTDLSEDITDQKKGNTHD